MPEENYDDLVLFMTDATYRQNYLKKRLADIDEQLQKNGYAVSGSIIVLPSVEEAAKLLQNRNK